MIHIQVCVHFCMFVIRCLLTGGRLTRSANGLSYDGTSSDDRQYLLTSNFVSALFDITYISPLFVSWLVPRAIIKCGLTRSIDFDVPISSKRKYPSLAAMSRLAAWIPALFGLIFMTMTVICFLGVAIYPLNTNSAAAISRRLKKADGTTQELADLTRLLHYMVTEAEKKGSIIEEKNAVINEKDAVIEEKVAIIDEKDAIVEERDAEIGAKELLISKYLLQITNLSQRLRRGATRAQNDQGHLKSKLKKATAALRKAAVTENPVIHQNAAEIDRMTMANLMIKDLQASLAAAGREAHEWRTEAYIAIVRKMPPPQRGLLLFGMDPRNFMPKAPIMQAYNPSDNLVSPARAPNFSTNVPPYPFPTPAQVLGPGPNG